LTGYDRVNKGTQKLLKGTKEARGIVIYHKKLNESNTRTTHLDRSRTIKVKRESGALSKKPRLSDEKNGLAGAVRFGKTRGEFVIELVTKDGQRGSSKESFGGRSGIYPGNRHPNTPASSGFRGGTKGMLNP